MTIRNQKEDYIAYKRKTLGSHLSLKIVIKESGSEMQ